MIFGGFSGGGGGDVEFAPFLGLSEDDPDGLTAAQVRNLFTAQFGESGVISGLGVSWSGTGFVYDIGPGTFHIGGVVYESSGGQVTLDAAHATNPRKDLFVVNTDGTVGKITGTPAAAPVVGEVNASTQVALTDTLVSPATTTPVGVSITTIYDEDDDWTTTESNASIVSNSTSNPRAGTKCIEITNASNGHSIVLDKGSTLDITGLATMPLWIRSKAAFGSRSLQLQWLNASDVAVGDAITISNNRLGFVDSVTGSYQLVVVPFASFNLTQALAPRKLRIRVNGGGTFTGCYIDDITLQTGQAPTFITQATSSGDGAPAPSGGGYVPHDSIYALYQVGRTSGDVLMPRFANLAATSFSGAGAATIIGGRTFAKYAQSGTFAFVKADALPEKKHMTGRSWAWQTEFYFNALDTNRMIWVGIVASGTDSVPAYNVNPTNCIAFRYNPNAPTSDNNYQIRAVTADASARTVTNTGVVLANSTLYKFRIEYDGATEKVRFYINDVLVATHTTNILADNTANVLGHVYMDALPAGGYIQVPYIVSWVN